MEILFSEGEPFLTVGLRIRHIRKSMKMTQKKFAESLGIVQGFLSAIEKSKKTPSDTLLIALQHLYKVNPDWIYSGQGEITKGGLYLNAPQPDKIGIIPFFDVLPADMREFRNSDRFDKYISLPGIPLDGFAFEYTGDYMLPTIRDGDIIVIKPDEMMTIGNIALIVGKWGEPILRRYREINGVAYFSSDNTSYAPFQAEASTKILGAVVKVWRQVNI